MIDVRYFHVGHCLGTSPHQCGTYHGIEVEAIEKAKAAFQQVGTAMAVAGFEWLFSAWFSWENPDLKWMMTGGTPMTLETPRCSSIVTPKDRWNSLCHHYFHILRWNPSHGIHGKWDDPPPFSHRPDGFEPRFRAIRMSQCIFTIVPPSSHSGQSVQKPSDPNVAMEHVPWWCWWCWCCH